MTDSSIQLLFLQPTPYCNIDCKYCYLPDRSTKDRMSGETLRKVFADLISSPRLGQRLDVLWGGGEPLVLPIEYYEEALAIIKGHSLPTMVIEHYIQTNGILLNDDWCEFFKTAGIKINVSIDGPQETHDANRLGRQGEPTFAETMAGIRCLQRHGIDFAVTSLLNAASLDKAREMHDFYSGEGFNKICFNIEEIEGSHRNSSLQGPEQETRFRNFMREFRDLVTESKSALHIREFDQMLRAIVDPPASGIRNILIEPLAVLSVDWRGRFSTFSPEFLGQSHPRYGDFVIGDVEAGLDAALGSERFRQLSAEVGEGVTNCRGSCEYFSLCGGGSPVTKLYENGSVASAETMSCRLRIKAVADLALESVGRSVEQQRQKNATPRDLLPGEADLYIVGTGIALPRHLTMETLDILRACSHVCTNLTDAQVASLPAEIRGKCQSLWPLYRADRARLQNYAAVQAAIAAAVEREKPVAWLTRGHPRIFDRVSEHLVKQGHERGWKVRVLPAISSIDTLLIEVDYDPGHGLLVHEATALVGQSIVPSPAIGMLLLQPDVFRSDLPHLSGSDPEPDLAPLRDYLLKFYDEGHRCAFVRSSSEPEEASAISWVRLADLCSVPYERIGGSTLFVSRRPPEPT